MPPIAGAANTKEIEVDGVGSDARSLTVSFSDIYGSLAIGTQGITIRNIPLPRP